MSSRLMMNLFTTSASPSDAATVDPIRDAIRDGAAKTGTDFDYLLATAQRESALDPKARAAGSSATGLFQFIEQTWLGLMKTEGPKLGLGEHAATISARPEGGYAVADPTARDAILGLRDDPRVASVLAGSLTQKNRDSLAAELGRDPSRGDLYVAHVLGARGAADLIQAARATPERPAAADFPDAAAANRSIFYDRGGRARGAGDVYARLAQSQAASAAPIFIAPTSAAPIAAAPTSTTPGVAADKPLAFAAEDRPGFHGLFQTDKARGPVSDAVARVWRGGDKPAPAPARRFFPRSETASAADDEAERPDTGEARAVASVSSTNADVAAADDGEAAWRGPVPLPPPRPVDLDRQGPRGLSRSKAPLDLGSFMQRRGA